MIFQEYDASRLDEIVELYTRVFSDSEGDTEGQAIGSLVLEMAQTTGVNDLMGLVALDSGAVVACIFFSRLSFEDAIEAFILSPVAVSTQHQRKGIGRRLIEYGIEKLRAQNIELVFTYGDPAYYSRFGFLPVSEQYVQAPQVLSHPEGWLGQSLGQLPLVQKRGICRCIDALNNPVYW